MHKPRLNLPKRTKQLHDAEPVVLKTDGTDDGTIWTTKGQKEMQPSDNEQLIVNLTSAKVQAAVERITTSCLEQAAQFLEVTIRSLMPPNLTLTAADSITWWMSKEGIEFRQDGLRSIVKRRGTVLAECEPEVPATWRPLVEARIRQIQRQSGGGQ